jgi:hypothetical protein
MHGLRVWYLWLKQIVRNALTFCSICGIRGVSSTSLRYPKAMCSECDAFYQKALKEINSVTIEALINAFGPQEFLFRYGSRSRNPLADSQESLEEYYNVVNKVCTIEEDELPCFDTFPSSPAIFGGHPAQNCSSFDKSRSMGIK